MPSQDRDHRSPAPLAVQELADRCMGSADVAILVLDKLEEQLGRHVQEIQERLAARDAAPIARTAHAMKGAAGMAAAPGVRDLAARIESLAKEGELDSIGDALTALHEEVSRCLAYLPTAREALRSSPPSGTIRKEPGA